MLKSIKSIELINEPLDRYELEIEDNHNYIVNGVVAHNACERLGEESVPVI